MTQRKGEKMKKYKFISILCLICFALASCATSEPVEEPTEPEAQEESTTSSDFCTGEDAFEKVAFITSTSRLGDQGFNDGVAEGVEQAARDLGLDYTIIQSYADTDYIPNLERAVESGYCVVMTAGFQMGDSIQDVAPRYPNAKFAGADLDLPECVENVREILFAEEEASYLLGVLTASMLELESHPIYETNKALGIVAGVEQPAVNRFITGYIAGARSVSQDVPIYVYFTGTWQNPDLFREAAIAAFNRGAGSIFEIGGVAGLSIIEAAKEFGFLEMTTDQDKNDLAPDHVLSSAMKDLTQATYLTVQDAVEGNWSGCEVRYTLANGGVKIAPFHGLAEYVPDEIMQRLDLAEENIISGEIVVPQTLEEAGDLLNGVEFERPAE